MLMAFCGSKGAGKDTSANLVKELYTGKVESLSLAGHLKSVCSKVFGVDMKYFTDPKLKEVELDTYIVLKASNLRYVFCDFGIDLVDYDKLIRPHMSKVLETPRQLLQYIGTEVLHPVDPLIHVKLMMKNKDPKALTLITDLRFENEFNYFKSQTQFKFKPYYVSNLNAEAAASGDMHPSERDLQKFKNLCVKIDNNGSISDLRNKLKVIIESLS